MNSEPNRVDAAGLAAFRVLFGLAMAAAMVRLLASGWLDTLYLAPDFHFTYAGFGWVRPLPAPWLHVQVIVLALAGLAVAFGIRARAAAAVFFVGFTWLELVDKSLYLNHYYLLSLLAFLFAIFRTDQVFALRPERQTPRLGVEVGHIDRRVFWLFRGQIAVVYIFAGLAKINADWLIAGEPLATWLQAHADWPVLGPWFQVPAVAIAMSWAGMLFDGTIPFWLLYRRTRILAYLVAIAFHAMVGVLFPIGVFPIVMVVAATIFFDPSWPRRLFRWVPLVAKSGPRITGQPPRRRPWLTAFVALWLTVQIVMPLRHFAIPGHSGWTEDGFWFAWRVMLIEKTGSLEYTVAAVDGSKSWRVFPRQSLARHQARALTTCPDFILEYGQHLGADYGKRGHGPMRVTANAWVSMNGRPAAQLVDPKVDLMTIPRGSWGPSTWLLPLPAPGP